MAMEEIQRQKRNIREWKIQQKLEQQQQEEMMQPTEIYQEEEETIEQLKVLNKFMFYRLH